MPDRLYVPSSYERWEELHHKSSSVSSGYSLSWGERIYVMQNGETIPFNGKHIAPVCLPKKNERDQDAMRYDTYCLHAYSLPTFFITRFILFSVFFFCSRDVSCWGNIWSEKLKHNIIFWFFSICSSQRQKTLIFHNAPKWKRKGKARREDFVDCNIHWFSLCVQIYIKTFILLWIV